jgi:hypothetical protein
LGRTEPCNFSLKSAGVETAPMGLYQEPARERRETEADDGTGPAVEHEHTLSHTSAVGPHLQSFRVHQSRSPKPTQRIAGRLRLCKYRSWECPNRDRKKWQIIRWDPQYRMSARCCGQFADSMVEAKGQEDQL